MNLKHYVSVVSCLAFKCAHIVKDCSENPNLKKYNKGVDDPVTDVILIWNRLTTKYKAL